MTDDAYKKSRDEMRQKWSVKKNSMQYETFNVGFNEGYNFALNGEEVRALVEALKKLGQHQIELHITHRHLAAYYGLAEEAIAAFQKARTLPK